MVSKVNLFPIESLGKLYQLDSIINVSNNVATMSSLDNNELISSKEVLEKSGISRATLNNYIKMGIIPKPIVQSPKEGVAEIKNPLSIMLSKMSGGPLYQ